MATRIERILSNARLTLADPNKERWDDPTLIAILNEAQIDFCQQTQMLHERVNVPIILGNSYFTLPDDCWKLTRVLYENSSIPLVTHQELDDSSAVNATYYSDLVTVGSNWEVATGRPLAVIYDRRNMLEGKIYPIPDKPLNETAYQFISLPAETFYNTDYYGVTSLFVDGELLDNYGVISAIADITQNSTVEPLYGVASALTIAFQVDAPKDGFGIVIDVEDYEVMPIFGTMVNIEDSEIKDTFEDVYGFVDTVVEASSFLKCYYLQNPSDLIDVNSIISIPSMYDIALKFYVCGQAFMNDIDTGYQQKGSDQMRIYERHIKTAKKDSAHDFTRAAQFGTTYRSGV